jgi:hypothetical protein
MELLDAREGCAVGLSNYLAEVQQVVRFHRHPDPDGPADRAVPRSSTCLERSARVSRRRVTPMSPET